MSTIELEAQKAGLAREILCLDNEYTIRNIWLLLKQDKTLVSQQKQSQKREIGILDGKAGIIFKDDWSMTTEELLELQ